VKNLLPLNDFQYFIINSVGKYRRRQAASRKNSNKFGFSLDLHYLCSRKHLFINKLSRKK